MHAFILELWDNSLITGNENKKPYMQGDIKRMEVTLLF